MQPTLSHKLPNGLVAARQTNRPYTHVLLGQINAAPRIEKHRSLRVVHLRNYAYFTQTNDSRIAGFPYADDYADHEFARAVAELEKLDGTWVALSWHSSEKLAAKGAPTDDWFRSVTVEAINNGVRA